MLIHQPNLFLANEILNHQAGRFVRALDPAKPRSAPLTAPALRRLATTERPRILGERRPTRAQRLADPKTPWQRLQVGGWYRGGERPVEIISGMAIWYHPGKHIPVPNFLVHDVGGAFEPQAFLCTDLQADRFNILCWFVRRWTTEATFAETHRLLRVETQHR